MRMTARTCARCRHNASVHVKSSVFNAHERGSSAALAPVLSAQCKPHRVRSQTRAHVAFELISFWIFPAWAQRYIEDYNNSLYYSQLKQIS